MNRLLLSVAGVRVVTALMQAVTLLILARSLGPTQFGQYAVLVSVLSFLAILLSFGTHSVALRVLATPNPKETAKGILTIRTVVFLPVLAISCGSLALSGLVDTWTVAAGGAAVVHETTAQVRESLLFGHKKPAQAQTLLLTRRALVLLLTSASLWFGLGALPFYTAGCILAAIGLYGFSRAEAFSVAAVRPCVRASRKYWLPSMLATAASLDVTVASGGLTGPGLGTFAAVSRISAPLQMVPGALLSIYTPHLAAVSSDAERRAVVGRACRMLGVVFGVFLLASPLIGMVAARVLGPDYEGAQTLLSIFVAVVAVSAFSQALIAYFYATDNPAPVQSARLVGLPLGLSAVFVFALVGGAAGAALGTVILHGSVLLFLAVSYIRSGRGPAGGSEP